MKSCLAVIGVAMLAIPVWFCGFFLHAYILVCYWDWFITPFGAAKINLFHAAGLVNAWSYVYYRTSGTNIYRRVLREKKEDAENEDDMATFSEVFTNVCASFGIMLLSLLVGYSMHRMMYNEYWNGWATWWITFFDSCRLF